MTGLFVPGITAEMFRNGCLESIEALMAEGEIYDIDYTRWIPVSERMPEKGGDYFVTICYDLPNIGTIRETRKNFFCILSKKWLYEDDEVIAWMPLPEPYKAESEDKE